MECNAEGRSDIRPKAIVEGDGAEINTRKKRNGVSKKTLLSPSHLPSRSACVCGGVCLNRHQSLGMTSTLLYVKAGAVVRGSPSALTSLSVFPPSNLFSRSVEATKKKKIDAMLTAAQHLQATVTPMKRRGKENKQLTLVLGGVLCGLTE